MQKWSATFERLLNCYGGCRSVAPATRARRGPPAIIETIDRLRKDAASSVRDRLLYVRAHYADWLGRMYYEAVDPALAEWSEKALDSAQQDGDNLMVACILLRRTSLAEDEHDPAPMIDLVEAARHTAALPAQISSLARHEAESYVLLHDEATVRRKIDRAVDLLAEARPEDDPPYAAGHSLGFLNLPHCQMFGCLGCFAEAIELYWMSEKWHVEHGFQAVSRFASLAPWWLSAPNSSFRVWASIQAFLV